MESVALAALVHAQPEGFNEASWLGQMLVQRWTRYLPPDEAAAGSLRAWVVGGVQDNETLVQARPVVRDPHADFLTDLLRAPTQTTLAAFAAVPGGPGSAALPPNLTMARFQRWIGVRAEGSLLPDARCSEIDDLRAALRADLPDFLQRVGGLGGDRELVVLSFLAALHAAGELGKAYAAPAAIRKALVALDERLGRPAAFNLMVSDGRCVGVLHRGGRLVALQPPAPPRPARAISQAPQRPTASLLLLDPHAASAASSASDPTHPTVPEGIFTVHVRQPGVYERD